MLLILHPLFGLRLTTLVAYASSTFSIKRAVFPRSIVFLDSRRIVVRYIRIHESVFHYFRCFTCIPPLHRVCFSIAVGVVCSGLLVGCTSFVRVPVLPVRLFTTRFFVLSRHDYTVLLTGASFPPLLFLSHPLYHFPPPSPCEGLRIQAPEYILFTFPLVIPL